MGNNEGYGISERFLMTGRKQMSLIFQKDKKDDLGTNKWMNFT